MIALVRTFSPAPPRHAPLATASALLAMANGLALEIFQDPEGDHDACIAADIDAALYLLGAERA